MTRQGNQTYGPYGNKRYSAGTMGTDLGYTGQRQDSLTGLDYYHARYYDPTVGRFVSADTEQGNAQGLDPYAYVKGNPETLTDPTGKHFEGCIENVEQCDPGFKDDPPTGEGCSSHCNPPTDGGGCQTGCQGQTTKDENKGGCNANVDTSDHCKAWNYDADKARANKTSQIHTKADWEMLGGYLLFMLGDILNIIKGGLFEKIAAVADLITGFANGMLPIIGSLLGLHSGAYVTALQISSALMKALAYVNGLVMLIGGANKIVKASVSATIDIALAAAAGPAGIFLQSLMVIARPVIGSLLEIGGHQLQSLAFADYAEEARQNDMSIQDWCAQYGGCPTYTTS